jgi:hypothetical protein
MMRLIDERTGAEFRHSPHHFRRALGCQWHRRHDDVTFAKQGAYLRNISRPVGEKADHGILRSLGNDLEPGGLEKAKDEKPLSDLGAQGIGWHDGHEPLAPLRHKERQHRLGLANTGGQYDSCRVRMHRPMRLNRVNSADLRRTQSLKMTFSVLPLVGEGINPRGAHLSGVPFIVGQLTSLSWLFRMLDPMGLREVECCGRSMIELQAMQPNGIGPVWAWLRSIRQQKNRRQGIVSRDREPANSALREQLDLRFATP